LESLRPDSNVLVINVARIGDTLLTSAVLRAIRAAVPEGRLGCLAHPKRVTVLENLPGVDELGAITPKQAHWRGWVGGRRWDCAIVYGHDAPLIRYAARVARNVVAFRQKNEALNRRLWHAVPVPVPREKLHVVEEALLLPQALGVTTDDWRLVYVPRAAELAVADAWLREEVGAGRPLIGFQIASFPTKSYRDWPLESFETLGRRILQRFPESRILILGGKESVERGRHLCSALGERASVAAGRHDLRISAALMQRLDLYVGVDTGPTHLAGALGIPMAALYHCFHRGRRFAPRGHERLRVIEHPRPDGKCSREVPMDEITVERTWEAVCDLLDADATRGAHAQR
jgi:heptosyltransferase-3